MSPTTGSPDRRRRRKARGALKHLYDQARIHGAIPAMSRRAATQALWLHALDNTEPYALLRADSTRNARAVAWALARYTDWETMVARPGWDLLIELTGLARSTVAKYLALFAEWGLLGRVSSGSTWRIRGGRDSDQDGNLAGEYVLCVPGREPVEETRTPSLLRQEERRSSSVVEVKPHARGRENKPWPINATPKRRGEQRQAAERLREQEPILRQLTAKHLARLLRPWFERGWNLAQLRYALNHTPDGEHRWHSDDVRHVPGWIAYRLAAWDGHVPPRQLGAGQSTDLSAADVVHLPAVGERSTADVDAHASLARRLLAATQKRSDKKPRLGLGVNLPDADGLQALVSEPVRPVERVADGDWLLRNAAARARTTSDMPGRVVA